MEQIILCSRLLSQSKHSLACLTTFSSSHVEMRKALLGRLHSAMTCCVTNCMLVQLAYDLCLALIVSRDLCVSSIVSFYMFICLSCFM